MNLFAEQPEKIVYTLNRMAVPMVAQTKYRNTYGIDVYRRGIQAVRGKGYYGGSGKIRKSDPSLQPGAALPAAFTGCGRRLFDLPLGDEDIL